MAMYDRQVSTAKRLIAKYGVSVPVTMRTITTPDPAKPWETIESIETGIFPVCFLPVDNKTLSTLSMMPGTEVPIGSVLGYMGAIPFNIDITATVEHDGKTWAIHYMDKLAPNGRIILHTMVLGA